MAGRRYCPFEGEYVDSTELEVVAGTLVHAVDPPHRVTDGMTVTIAADRKSLVVDSVAAVEAVADAMPDDAL